MKLSKTILFNALIFFTFGIGQAGTLWTNAGIYDFSNDVAREFYKFGWSGRLAYEVPLTQNSGLELQSGANFSTVPYNGEEHEMYLFPLQLSWKYYFTNGSSKWVPYFGTGVGAYYKMDNNEFFKGRRWAFLYGYQLCSGLKYTLGKTVPLRFELRYNLLMPPNTQDLNSSGMDVLIGIGFAL